MNTVKIYQLNQLSRKPFWLCKAAQMEAAKVWNRCMELQLHKAAHMAHTRWPGRGKLQEATKGGQFELHSQSVQMVAWADMPQRCLSKEPAQPHPTGRVSSETGQTGNVA